VLENFASSLSVLDPFTFQRVVGPQMGLLIDSIIDDEAILIVPKTFLQQNLNISSDFAACLIHALMEDVDALDIGVAESDDKKVLHSADMKMTLFSMIFSSLSVSPKNEKVLRPHLQQLIAVCLRRAMGSDMKFWPGNHFTILRQLFRAIAGGKFEESYKEILPLLPTLLNGLYRVYCNTDHDTLKKVIIELCLTIPARLSSLLPHLSLLLRIIVPALQTNDGDLINLG
jgi:transformation/transcription domain-associated protein